MISHFHRAARDLFPSFPSSSHFFFFFFFFFFFCCCVERMTFPVFFSERSVGWRGNSRLAWVFLLRANLKTPREISKTREHWGIWGVFLSLSRWSHVFHTPQNTKSTLHLHRPLHEKKREVSKKKKRRDEKKKKRERVTLSNNRYFAALLCLRALRKREKEVWGKPGRLE